MHWLAHGEHEVPDHLDWLSPLEASRLDGIRFTKRRCEFLLRRWTGKQAVAAAVGLPTDPASMRRVEVLNRRTGAPFVHVDGAPPGLDISLSDRAGWAVCLVGAAGTADSGTVGVDLEIVEPRSPGFVSDFLTGPEQCYVHAQPDGDAWHAAANLLWSAKEAALKVLQTGLRADTRTVEVSVDHEVRDDGWAALSIAGQGGRAFPGWWRRDGSFLLTIAYDRPSPPPSAMAATADLAGAVPVHSWLTNPRLP